MGQVLSLPFRLFNATTTYYRGLFYYLFGAGRTGPYSTSTTPFGLRCIHRNSSASDITTPLVDKTTTSDDDKAKQKQDLLEQHARIHLYSLACDFYLYNKPHYRKSSYRLDLIDNLRNVAVPGTGIRLSNMVCNRVTMLSYLLTIYPMICGISSLSLWIKTKFQSSLYDEYVTRLLAPDDWFRYWRLNCTVVGLHSLLNDMPVDYTMENKWTFLQTGDQRHLPISPFLKADGYVIKHKNEEGGLGIYFYKNAVVGGDWIIQQRIHNSAWVSTLLPQNAPLSTFRVMTQSRCCIDNVANRSNIQAVSCVFRAGRANAATDHDSILFDVDMSTGIIQGGTTNAHWYQLGLYNAIVKCPLRSFDEDRYTYHPDDPTIQVSGQQIPNFMEMIQLVEQSHYDMCPTVPFAGWDVVLSADPDVPVCLLEVNLSCNFFRGSFDQKSYFDFVDDVFTKTQELRIQADQEKKKF